MFGWSDFLFKKKLSLSLFIILPAVLALTSFASGFIALILIENFTDLDVKSFSPPSKIEIQELMLYVKIEILAFTGIGALAGLGIAYAIVNPLKSIVGQTRQVAHGDFSANLNVDRLDELGIFGVDFNRMVSSLNQYFISNMTAGWLLLDERGKIVSINPGAQYILGCQSDSLIDRNLDALADYVSPVAGIVEIFQSTLDTQKPVENRELVLNIQDQREIPLTFSTSILSGADQKYVGLNVNDPTRAQEITEHMQQAEKLASLGGLAAGLAHEIRNPLGSIKGLTQLLEEELSENSKARQYTQTMVKEIDRLNGVVSNLLNFSQPTESSFDHCDLREVIEQVLGLAFMDANKKRISVVKDLPESLPPVWGENKKLVQAFLNILLNATEAVPPEGEIGVKVWSDSALFPDARAGVAAEISNTGKPIPSNLEKRIFDPFFTTKESGTGLGLAITHQIVNLHRGSLTHYFKNGRTVFVVKLPVEPSGKSEKQTLAGGKRQGAIRPTDFRPTA